MALHPRLSRDCHHLFELEHSSLLLHRSSSVPWLIVVPHGEWSSLLDMDVELRARVVFEWHEIASALRTITNCDKINLASIGNIVSQLHLHVLARSKEDLFWPDVVWGQELGEAMWSDAEVQRWRERLREAGCL